MTETTTAIEPPTETTPFGILTALIAALLAPMFVGVTGGDIALARAAALATLDDYRARNHADLIGVAQIVAFGLAALGSLSLSMADDLSLAMTLRLRGNAVACMRAAEQNRRALTLRQAEDALPAQPWPPGISPDPFDDTPPPAPELFLGPEAEQMLAAEAQARLDHPVVARPIPSPAKAPAPSQGERRHQEMWAIALTHEAGEIAASLPHLPPAERAAATMRAALLSGTAHDLMHGKAPRVDLAHLTGLSAAQVSRAHGPLSVA
jgi:hypothetical protein